MVKVGIRCKCTLALAFLCLNLGLLDAQNVDNSLLWKVSSAKFEHDSYLYGTMHAAEERILNFRKEVRRALASCDAFAMEVLIDSSATLSIYDKMMMKGDVQLRDLMAADDYQILKKLVFDKMGVPLMMFSKMQPMFISAMLVEPKPQKHVHEAENMLPVDLQLAEDARRNGLKISGIETMEEQIDAISALSYQKQAHYLIEQIRDFEKSERLLDDLMQAYINEDLNEISRINDEEPMPKKLQKSLIVRRNKKMASRLKKAFNRESTFAAIGALHLTGKTGLIRLMRKKGFLVEPVLSQGID